MNGTRHVAHADCEPIRPGLVAQPWNTASSVALAAAAVPLVRAGGRWRLVAAAAAVEGLGSVLYHGPGGRVGKAVHDAGLVALVVTLGVAVGPDPRRTVRPSAAALGWTAAVLHPLSRTGGPLCRRGVRGHALFHLVAATALAAAPRSPHPSRRRAHA